MWRGLWSGVCLKQSISAAVRKGRNPVLRLSLWREIAEPSSYASRHTTVRSSQVVLWRRFSTSGDDSESRGNVLNISGDFKRTEEREGEKKAAAGKITYAEAKKLMRLVNVESLKLKLASEGKEVVRYQELVEACQSLGVVRSQDEAAAFASVLDEAGVVLLFRDKVYLHPDKVVDLVRRAVPLALTPENDPMRDELKRLQEKKAEIDVLAHKQVTRILWAGLGLSMLQVGLFFRLTFWEFSWDVMEPIAFFTTATGIVIGYGYFMFTARDPSYQDLMKTLFLSRQRKLLKRQSFDVDRFKELQYMCKTPLDANSSIRNHLGLELELEDAFQRN